MVAVHAELLVCLCLQLEHVYDACFSWDTDHRSIVSEEGLRQASARLEHMNSDTLSNLQGLAAGKACDQGVCELPAATRLE